MDFATWLITSPWQCCLMTSVIQALNRTAGPRKHLRQPIRAPLRQPIGPGARQTHHRSVSVLMDIPLFCVIGRTRVRALGVPTLRAPADNNRASTLLKSENTVSAVENLALLKSLSAALHAERACVRDLHWFVYDLEIFWSTGQCLVVNVLLRTRSALKLHSS